MNSSNNGAQLAQSLPTDPSSVIFYGAVGDGATDDTVAFRTAIDTLDGADVVVPAGVYLLDNLVITGRARLRLDEGATLRHKPSGTLGMVNMVTGTEFAVHGGTFDGNWQNQTTVTYGVIAAVPSGAQVTFDSVRVINGASAAIRATGFGGYVAMLNCTVTGQKEHNGSSTGQTNVIQIVSGQENAKGLLRFNNNRCIGTTTPVIDGGNPGGVFFATNGYDPAGGGGSGTAGFANGNRSTFEAIGNYFFGYGQHAGPHDISPLHCYPTIAGARFIGNIFEKCGFSAISAKSVVDFVCQGNTILDGLVSTKNTAQEGAILYGPGYQASNFSRPNAVISGNIITNPGGEPTVGQTCISVMGTPTSLATGVVVSDNVLTTTGCGINIQNVDDVSVHGNTIRTREGGAANTAPGIRVSHAFGDIRVRGNDIEAYSDGIVALTNTGTARFFVEGNLFKAVGISRVGANLRGMNFVKVADNTIDNPAGPAVQVMGNGTTNVGRLVFDRSNTIISGSVNLTHAQIDNFEGREPASAVMIASGPAGGTGASYSITGDSDSGVIQITTGTGTVVGGLATITLARTYRTVRRVILAPANAAAADLRTRTIVSPFTSNTTSKFVMSVAINRMLESTDYAWYYEVL